MRDVWVMPDSHHGLARRFWVTSLMAFCDGVMSLVEKGKVTNAIYVGLCKAFGMVLPPYPYLSIGEIRSCGVGYSVDKELVGRP